MSTIDDLLHRFRETAIANAEWALRDPEKANRAYYEGLACYKVLKDTEQGRKGIIELMDDEDPYVRLVAAAHSLQWAPKAARRVLEELRDSDGPGAFSAKWTLIEYDKGRLTFTG